MRLASKNDEIHAAGAEVLAIVVDSPERNAAMARRWGLPFRILSDPGGERWLQRLDLWNEKERGGIAIGGTLVIDPDGTEVFRTRARDFADRLSDEPALDALRGLDVPSIDPPPPAWVPEVEAEAESPGFRPDSFGTYFRGYSFGAFSLELRTADPAAKSEAAQARAMAQGMLEAWKLTQERARAT